jgi:hypothetical protein
MINLTKRMPTGEQRFKARSRNGRMLALPPRASVAEYVECGGKRSATPLWSQRAGLKQQERRRRFALPAHSIWWYSKMRPPETILLQTAHKIEDPSAR